MLSDNLNLYLEKCGHPKRKIKNLTAGTKLYHDMNIYGDIAEAYMEVLEGEFSVDMSEFYFEQYFPSEFYNGTMFMAFIFSVAPVLRWRVEESKNHYIPVTLEMIDESIERRVWQCGLSERP